MSLDSQSPSAASDAPANPPIPKTWDELGLSNDALQLIQKAGFQAPTPVQAQTIPLALDGCDLIASAQTGTGKTASFVLPMVERFAGRQGTFGLILCPTRNAGVPSEARKTF
jgi:ATP-dependent RNA helicase RhlE